MPPGMLGSPNSKSFLTTRTEVYYRTSRAIDRIRLVPNTFSVQISDTPDNFIKTRCLPLNRLDDQHNIQYSLALKYLLSVHGTPLSVLWERRLRYQDPSSAHPHGQMVTYVLTQI